MTRPLLDDVRYAWRTLRHSPWYTLTVVGVLGSGLAPCQRRVRTGGTAGRVTRLVLAEQFTAVLTGLAAGSVVSAWMVRYLESRLFGLTAYDPMVWTAVAATIVSVALIGGLVPATRAARIDPVAALRVE